jgi:hypothetical protein
METPRPLEMAAMWLLRHNLTQSMDSGRLALPDALRNACFGP